MAKTGRRRRDGMNLREWLAEPITMTWWKWGLYSVVTIVVAGTAGLGFHALLAALR